MCPVEPFDSDHIHYYNGTETNTLHCAVSDQLKYNSLDNEAYAGNCLTNVFILDVLSLSTILDSAQFLPSLAKWQELFIDHDWITQ